MTTPLLVPFYTTVSLEDVAAVADSSGLYAVMIDHTKELAPSNSEMRLEKTMWRVWKPVDENGGWHEVSHRAVVVPLSSSLVMTSQGDRLFAVAQVNGPVPASLLCWPTGSAGVAHFSESSAASFPIELDGKRAPLVAIPPRQEWNTYSLPPAGWLFYPSISNLPDGKQVAVTASTADGHAVWWISEGAAHPQPLGFVPNALNPVFLRISGSDYLFYRVMPAGWSVFYHDLRHSNQFGPIALPLAMARLDKAGEVAQVLDMSKDQDVGSVFDFAASPAGNRLVIAVIAGTREAPELRVYLDDSSGKLHIRQTTRVRSVPYRLTLAATEAEAVIAMAHGTQQGYELEGMTLKLQ